MTNDTAPAARAESGPSFVPPVEPPLEMDDIQGIAVPGFFKSHQTLLYIQVDTSKRAVLEKFQAFIRRIS